MHHVKDLKHRTILSSTLEPAIGRRDALGLAVLAALRLPVNDGCGHMVGTAQHEANTRATSGSGRKVVRVARSVKHWRCGRSVSHGKWQPGGLVFFKNTFERGLPHVGIFIREGRFIHAENQKTGVVISSLESEYYRNHYAGARRRP